MSRFRGPKGKVVRRLGVNVFANPKYDRLLTKRPQPPGIHGAQGVRRRVSEYGRQLVEKQKLRFTYGLREKQFRALFDKASRMSGVTGHNFVGLLERRLDNVVYRAGMASTRDAARQLVTHGHITVNGVKTNIPSFSVKQGDVVAAKDTKRSKGLVTRNMKENNMQEKPEWLEADGKNGSTSVLRLPIGSEVQTVADLQMIVELYSR